MGVISMSRAEYQRPNVRIGQSKKPKRIASHLENEKINLAIVALNDAKLATSEPQFLVQLSEAVKIARDLWRGRNDV